MGRPKGSKNKPKPPAPAAETRAVAKAAETKAVAKLPDVSEHVRKINHLAKKINDYEDTIIQEIAAIKKARPDDWKTVVKNECTLGRSRMYELLAITDGTKTVEQVRAATAKRSREKRKRDKESVAQRTAPAEGNGPDPEAAAEARKAELAKMEEAAEKADGAITPLTGLERADRRAAFLERCEQAIGFATYSGPVDDEVADAAERVAAAWERKACELRGKVQDAKAFDNHAARGDGSDPEASAKVVTDPDLSDSLRRAPKVA